MPLPSYKNRVGNTVTGTPGTGTITLSTADTGHQTFAAAYGANANVDILIEEGDAWEIARDCTYTHSGTTVTRGTLEASSTGSALSLTSAAKVYVIESAERMRKGVGGYLEHQTESLTTAGVTGVVGTMHVLDISGLTADRDFTLPAVAAVGDRVGVMLSVGDASFEMLIKPAAGDTINGGAVGAEWSRLFITNEVVIFRCVTADSAWIVEQDGRIGSSCRIDGLGKTNQEISDVTWTTIAGTLLSNSVFDIGSLADTANGRIYPRRSGKYIITVTAIVNNITTGNLRAQVENSAGTTLLTTPKGYISSEQPSAAISSMINFILTTDVYLRMAVRTATGGGVAVQASGGTYLECVEVF